MEASFGVLEFRRVSSVQTFGGESISILRCARSSGGVRGRNHFRSSRKQSFLVTSPLCPGELVPTPVCSPALTDRVQSSRRAQRSRRAAPHALRSACRAPACMLAFQILSCLHTVVFCMHCIALLPLAMPTLTPSLTFFLFRATIDRTTLHAGRRLPA